MLCIYICCSVYDIIYYIYKYILNKNIHSKDYLRLKFWKGNLIEQWQEEELK